MKKYVLLGLMSFSLLWSVPSYAISIGFSPSSQSVLLGNPVNVDVVVSDLGDEIVSAFALKITYDPSILFATGVTFGPYLGDPLFFEAFTGFALSPGIVELAELSLLSDLDLDMNQPNAFALATLSFDSVAVGTSSLGFDFDSFFNDVIGLNADELVLIDISGSVTVSPRQVPEPTSFLLFGSGLLGLGFARRVFGNNTRKN